MCTKDLVSSFSSLPQKPRAPLREENKPEVFRRTPSPLPYTLEVDEPRPHVPKKVSLCCLSWTFVTGYLEAVCKCPFAVPVLWILVRLTLTS